MGYGQILKEKIDSTPGMTVNKLSTLTKIPSSTLYSIIKRDSPIRYDFAIRLANTLDIPVSDICKDNPYTEPGEAFPDFPVGFEKMFPNKSVDITLEYHLKPVLMILGGKEAANVEQLLTTYAKLTDAGRAAVFDNLNTLEKIATDPDRAKEVSEKIKKFKKDKKNQS